MLPAEIVVIDASEPSLAVKIDSNPLTSKGIEFKCLPANFRGAAQQRTEGLGNARFDLVCFMDDDIVLEPDCLRYLYEGITTIELAGGVNALITNQQYIAPGLLTATMYRIMNGQKLNTYAGKILGPAWNILPQDNSEFPDYVPCEWLNTTCVMYKRAALPVPLFDSFFKDYSFMEDVALSIEVGKRFRLFNARHSKIFHDSRSGSHKSNLVSLSSMMLVNRYWVMTQSLNRKGLIYLLKLLLLECFGVVTSLRSWSGWHNLPAVLAGKVIGLMRIAFGTKRTFLY